MSMIDNDQPLGEQFLQNPYEFFQSFVRNMNNEIFLSQYQLGHLYSLLLLKRQSPWDELKPNNETLKTQIQQLVNAKVIEVKKMLQSLSQIYENKLKKNTFTQIQRLMSILKAKKKSIFIEKDFHQMQGKIRAEGRMVHNILSGQQKGKDIFQGRQLVQIQTQKPVNISNNSLVENKQQQNLQVQQRNDFSCQTEPFDNNVDPQFGLHSHQQQHLHQHQHEHSHQQSHQHGTVHSCKSPLHQIHKNQSQSMGDEREVLSLFYSIANIPNLSSLALGNCLEYSAAERYIKFQMSKNYIMTIKNDDEMLYDRCSVLKNVSSDLFIHGVFPYLTAVELFKSRAVCKEWLENVKQAWHSTFKRQMFVQLIACEFCKQIEFYYKLIQLRNPFFQKVSLLMHALIEIIQWQKVNDSINDGTIAPQLKKVLLILLKLIGEPIVMSNMNSLTQQLWQQHKHQTLNLKPKLAHFLNNIQSSGLSIFQLTKIKLQLLDDPFMRVQELNSEDKTPLLLVIFIKQLTLQQILKNHIYFSQMYLMDTKKRLDNVSSKMPQQKGFLQGVYKIILLRSFGNSKSQEGQQKEQKSEMPNFASILSSIFDGNEEMDKPDFVLKSQSTLTNIYMDKATKLDIIVSTVKKMNAFESFNREEREKITSNETKQERQNNDSQQMQEQSLPKQRLQPQQMQIERQQNFSNTNKPQQQNLPKKQLKKVNLYNINLNQQQKQKTKQQKQQNNQSHTKQN